MCELAMAGKTRILQCGRRQDDKTRKPAIIPTLGKVHTLRSSNHFNHGCRDPVRNSSLDFTCNSGYVAREGQDQIVTPWDVRGSVSSDGKQQAIDYDKLIDQFGTRRIDAKLLERFEKLTGQRPHVFLRRGMFFSHRYIAMLDISSLSYPIPES
jgi:hypothetical protein